MDSKGALAVCGALTYSGVVAYCAVQKYGLDTLYTYHPLAAAAFMVCAVAALVTAHAAQRGSHKARITWHGYYNAAATLFALATSTVIYVNKERNNRPHLVSWHGQAGAATAVLWAVLSISGGAAWYLPRLVSQYVPLRQAYIQHGLGGVAATALLFTTHSLALGGGYQGFKKGTAGWWGVGALLALVALALAAGVPPLLKRANKLMTTPAAAAQTKTE